MASDNVIQKAKTSMVWSFIEKVSVQGTSFLISLVLARLLMPQDYGVIAIISIFMSVASVFIDSGLSSALIQKQDRTDSDYTTAFFTNIIVASLCYVTLFLTASPISVFFETPILKDVTRVYAIVLIIGSLSIVQKTRCYIEYNFRLLAAVSLFAILCGGISAIYFAYNDYGVWSLVYYNLITETIRTAGLWIVGRWYPRLVFSKKSFLHICKFGTNVLGANMINVITANFYTFVVGKLFSATSLGFYSRGQSMAYILPSNVSNMVVQASYPIFCELQSDREKLSFVFQKYIRLVFALVAPIMALLVVLSKPLVIILLTEKWLDSVYFIQILAIAYAFDPVMRLNANVINVTGRSDYTLKAEILKKVALIGLLILSYSFGLKAMTIALAFYSFADLYIVSFYVRNVTGVTLLHQVKLLLPIICYSVISGAICSFVKFLLPSCILQILIGGCLGILAYMLLVYWFSGNIIVDLRKIKK